MSFVNIVFVMVSESIRYEYRRYINKRLQNVIKTVLTSSKLGCVRLCSQTDGCLAVNVIGNHNVTCELTTGLSNENEMKDVESSGQFVLSNLSVSSPGPS